MFIEAMFVFYFLFAVSQLCGFDHQIINFAEFRTLDNISIERAQETIQI